MGIWAKYDLISKTGAKKFVHGIWGLIDFNTMTVKQADELVSRGFPYLELKKEKQVIDMPEVESDEVMPKRGRKKG
ncbi:MAG: hypothetical protein KA954_11445 [Chitinophagales bacterium]|nr:hypothetical protein [Chitinophagales bacterium]MBP9704637.1 hypothetical protein [Chitinophagales bacterium]